MRFANLGSGSRGNATLVACGDTRVLIDCGFSAREAERRLAGLGINASELSGILVTHEHSDHVQGVELLSRRYNLPVFLSEGTLQGLRKPVQHFNVLRGGERLEIGELQVDVVSVAHDAREPTQFVFKGAGKRLGVLTDLGSYCPRILRSYEGVDALMIESNHCPGMLASGPYPYFLQRRVGGDHGHLSNQQAANLVKDLGWQHLQHLVLAHLSSKNNQPALARQTFVDTLGCDADWLQLADQDSGLGWRHIA